MGPKRRSSPRSSTLKKQSCLALATVSSSNVTGALTSQSMWLSQTSLWPHPAVIKLSPTGSCLTPCRHHCQWRHNPVRGAGRWLAAGDSRESFPLQVTPQPWSNDTSLSLLTWRNCSPSPESALFSPFILSSMNTISERHRCKKIKPCHHTFSMP